MNHFSYFPLTSHIYIISLFVHFAHSYIGLSLSTWKDLNGSFCHIKPSSSSVKCVVNVFSSFHLPLDFSRVFSVEKIWKFVCLFYCCWRLLILIFLYLLCFYCSCPNFPSCPPLPCPYSQPPPCCPYLWVIYTCSCPLDLSPSLPAYSSASSPFSSGCCP